MYCISDELGKSLLQVASTHRLFSEIIFFTVFIVLVTFSFIFLLRNFVQYDITSVTFPAFSYSAGAALAA